MRSPQMRHLTIVDQLRQAVIALGIAAVVADHRQILDACLRNRVQNLVRSASAQKTADHNGHAVFDLSNRLVHRNNFSHECNTSHFLFTWKRPPKGSVSM